MRMGQRWNDNDREKSKCSEKNLSKCHFVNHKSHTDGLGSKAKVKMSLPKQRRHTGGLEAQLHVFITSVALLNYRLKTSSAKIPQPQVLRLPAGQEEDCYLSGCRAKQFRT